MTRPGLAETIRTSRGGIRAVAIAGLVLLSGVLASVFALEQAGSDRLAWWWPATAVGAVAAAATPARWRWSTAMAIGFAAAAAAGLADRPPLVIVLGAAGPRPRRGSSVQPSPWTVTVRG